MAGLAGRSGGHNRKSLTALQVAGTFTPSRHNHLLKAAVSPPDWHPTPDELAALGAAGQRFVTQMVDAYTFSLSEGILLLEAAQAVAALATWRAQPRDGKALRLALQLDRRELAWQKQLTTLLVLLKVSS